MPDVTVKPVPVTLTFAMALVLLRTTVPVTDDLTVLVTPFVTVRLADVLVGSNFSSPP